MPHDSFFRGPIEIPVRLCPEPDPGPTMHDLLDRVRKCAVTGARLLRESDLTDAERALVLSLDRALAAWDEEARAVCAPEDDPLAVLVERLERRERQMRGVRDEAA